MIVCDSRVGTNCCCLLGTGAGAGVGAKIGGERWLALASVWAPLRRSDTRALRANCSELRNRTTSKSKIGGEREWMPGNSGHQVGWAIKHGRLVGAAAGSLALALAFGLGLGATTVSGLIAPPDPRSVRASRPRGAGRAGQCGRRRPRAIRGGWSRTMPAGFWRRRQQQQQHVQQSPGACSCSLALTLGLVWLCSQTKLGETTTSAAREPRPESAISLPLRQPEDAHSKRALKQLEGGHCQSAGPTWAGK